MKIRFVNVVVTKKSGIIKKKRSVYPTHQRVQRILKGKQRIELTNSVGLWVDSLFGFQIRCTWCLNQTFSVVIVSVVCHFGNCRK